MTKEEIKDAFKGLKGNFEKEISMMDELMSEENVCKEIREMCQRRKEKAQSLLKAVDELEQKKLATLE
jgi:uncharacterized protein (UPF0147 family)